MFLLETSITDRAGVPTRVRNYIRGLNPRFFLGPGMKPQDDRQNTIKYTKINKKMLDKIM